MHNRELRLDDGDAYGENGSMSIICSLNATDYVHIRQSSPVVTVHGNTYYTWFAGSFLG